MIIIVSTYLNQELKSPGIGNDLFDVRDFGCRSLRNDNFDMVIITIWTKNEVQGTTRVQTAAKRIKQSLHGGICHRLFNTSIVRFRLNLVNEIDSTCQVHTQLELIFERFVITVFHTDVERSQNRYGHNHSQTPCLFRFSYFGRLAEYTKDEI